jgi:hypothetical protein
MTLFEHMAAAFKAYRLLRKHGEFGADPEFPREDWMINVEFGLTHLGYWDWVVECRRCASLWRNPEEV